MNKSNYQVVEHLPSSTSSSGTGAGAAAAAAAPIPTCALGLFNAPSATSCMCPAALSNKIHIITGANAGKYECLAPIS